MPPPPPVVGTPPGELADDEEAVEEPEEEEPGFKQLFFTGRAVGGSGAGDGPGVRFFRAMILGGFRRDMPVPLVEESPMLT